MKIKFILLMLIALTQKNYSQITFTNQVVSGLAIGSISKIFFDRLIKENNENATINTFALFCLLNALKFSKDVLSSDTAGQALKACFSVPLTIGSALAAGCIIEQFNKN